jgi:diguanylate cyclase (GGDEF)-like protein
VASPFVTTLLRRTRPAASLLLGHEPRLRVRTKLTLLALLVYVACAALQQAEVVLGLVDGAESHLLSAFNLSGALGFYLAMRSGLSQRWGSDPSLMMAQSSFALLSITWAYAITGPARGAVVGVMLLVILFGMFSLRPTQARRLALGGFAGLAAVMAWRSLGANPRYEPRVELVHLVLAAVVLGATAALVMRLARLRARLVAHQAELEAALEANRQLATRDMLTGLLNRRAMAELLAHEAPQPRRRSTGGPLAVALLDIDHFKRVNDLHGHAAGDEVLRRFAEVARLALRAGDTMARWGGEEFLLLMPAATPGEAAAVLQRLRLRLATTGFDDIAPGLRISFSAGVSPITDGQGHALALDAADRALYRAKHSGRDRVAFAEADAAPDADADAATARPAGDPGAARRQGADLGV